MAIRKIQYAPDKGSEAPSAETTCEFIMSDKPLHMRVSLEKEVRRPASSYLELFIDNINISSHNPEYTYCFFHNYAINRSTELKLLIVTDVLSRREDQH